MKRLEQRTSEELVQGYYLDKQKNTWCCVHCSQQFERGEIFPVDKRLVDARKAAELHVTKEHGSAFQALLALGKKATGLSDTQARFTALFYSGMADADIARETGTSPSAVRFQRYSFRERVRQAKALLALAELLERAPQKGAQEEEIPVHARAKMVDERYMVTRQEADKIIAAHFSSTDPLVLHTLSPKEKKKVVILRTITGQFEVGRRYTEHEVNEILKPIFGDFVTLRRYLIEYGFFARETDGSAYWRTDAGV